MTKIPLTVIGATKLRAELQELKGVQRPAIITAIAEARSHGDLSENAEYAAAKERQSFIEGRSREIESVLAQADVIDPGKLSGTRVVFGATVKLTDVNTSEDVTYSIVGDYEADIKLGRISISAPLARAMIGKDQGDTVILKTGKGTREYEIARVIFEDIA